MGKQQAHVSADALEDDYLVEDIIEGGETDVIEGEEIFGNVNPDHGSASLKRKPAEEAEEEQGKKKKKKKPKKVCVQLMCCFINNPRK